MTHEKVVTNLHSNTRLYWEREREIRNGQTNKNQYEKNAHAHNKVHSFNVLCVIWGQEKNK